MFLDQNGQIRISTSAISALCLLLTQNNALNPDWFLDKYLGWVLSPLEIDPEACDVDDQADNRDNEEFHLQMRADDLQQQFDFGLQDGAEEQQFHQSLLLLLFTLTALDFTVPNEREKDLNK